MAALAVDVLVYPLDTIKTRMQAEGPSRSRSAPASTSTSASPAAAARRLAQHSVRWRGLYQGMGSVVLATLPASGVFFTTYEAAKRVVGRAPLPLPPPLVHALASGTAELASCLVLTPAEVIKQNAQMIARAGGGAGGKSRSTSLQALRMLLSAKEGGGGSSSGRSSGNSSAVARRLWSGYTALAARNLPFTALQFPLFEAMRARLRRALAHGHGNQHPPDGRAARPLLLVGAISGLSAGTSGAVAAVVTTPADVVKTRIMLAADPARANRATQAAAAGGRESGALRPLHLLRTVYREAGIPGLFRGGALRAAWTFVGSGLYLGTYEMAKTWLRSDSAEGEADDGI